MAARTSKPTSNLLQREIKLVKEEIRRLDKKADHHKFILGAKIDKVGSDTRDLVLEVLSEVKDMREEQAAHQMAHDRQQDTLDNHEERVTTLEKTA